MPRTTLTPAQRKALRNTLLIELHPADTAHDRTVTVQLGEELFDDTGEGTMFDAILLHDHEANLVYTGTIQPSPLDTCEPGTVEILLDSAASAPMVEVTPDDGDDDEADALERALADAKADTGDAPLWRTYNSTATARRFPAASSAVLPSTLPSTFATLKELP